MLRKKLALNNYANTNWQKPSNINNLFTISCSSKVTSKKPSAKLIKYIEKQSYVVVVVLILL